MIAKLQKNLLRYLYSIVILFEVKRQAVYKYLIDLKRVVKKCLTTIEWFNILKAAK
jgi:hypothetical protein